MYQIGIIGNGISAQIAALAAASARCQVTLFEAGTVPAKLAHAHLLLAGSWQALLELAPDLASDLDSRDFADITRDWSFHSAIGKITTRPCRLSTPVLSAEKLLTILKEAVRRRPNIAIQSITAAGMSALLKNPGPNPYFLATGMLTPLTATILTGFTGHSLERKENAKPSVYSSFNFQLPPGDVPRWRVKIRDMRCDGRNGLLAQIFENDSALVSAVSTEPIRTIQALANFLFQIDESGLAKILIRSELISPIKWHRFPGPIRRVTNIFEGWQPYMCLFGDAAMSTDPYFGHGIFLAAVQGLALKDALRLDSGLSLDQRLDIFRTRQDHLLSRCLALHDKLGSPHVLRKVPNLAGWQNSLYLQIYSGFRQKFMLKIHMIEFLENIKSSWSKLNEKEVAISRLSGDEIVFSSMERLIAEDQGKPIIASLRRGAAMDGRSI